MITPEYISSLVSFNASKTNEEWQYNPMGKDMFNLQAQGASRIYNILEEHKVALLADEVGMGKTIQALSVCVALWNENPNARILILVPRDEILSNWEKEYQTFIRHHYKHHDDIVKALSGQIPVKKLIRCANLFDLVKEIQSDWGKFFIGKISSFSNLMSREDIVERVETLGIKNLTKLKNLSGNRDYKLNNEIASLLKNEIVNYADGNKPYFDLVIIDEAHYFRHKDGDSLRVQTAEEIFGRPGKDRLLSKKVLLMTATPNHSSSRDINNIVSYFSNRFKGWEHTKILEHICVRRLRRLGKGSYNKYMYREEKEAESNFNNNPLGEMFFALYQHQLAKQLKEQQEASSGRGVSRMMKYLEGVEFIPFEKSNTEEQEEGKQLATDFSSGSDASILHGLSNKFRDIFGTDPSHPKYEKLVADLTLNHNGEKAVVFVRRIPSVFEIAKRIMDFYDKQFWSKMQHGEYASLNFEKLDRKSFKRFSQSETIDMDDVDETQLDAENDKSNIPTSKVINLFKKSKSDAIRSTDASNFRLRFTRSKPGIFTMFFSPCEDYFSAPYQQMVSYRYDVSGRQLDNYFNSALLHRTNKIEDHNATQQEILSVLLTKQPLNQDELDIKETIPTLFTLFWNIFLSDEGIDDAKRNNLKYIYKSYSHYEKEAFSAFIEKAALYASEAMIWFYEIYRKIRAEENDNVVSTYLRFCEEIKLDLKSKKLYQQIQESILHFKNMYTKVFSINGEQKLLEEKWDNFDNAQPIYPYNADNSSKKVLSCFNTPFYPDMLVATSVLQEGVNLQYFCNNVYHYGMAWTPGDNEQRIGRIDRMFGKIERLLDEKQEDARLHIYYPYLKNTIDEEQLRRFIKRKFNEENLIDRGMSIDSQGEVNYQENDNDSWKLFLRKPETTEKKDPFPVDINSFNKIPKYNIKTSKFNSLQPIFHSIINAIEEIKEIELSCFFVENSESPKILIDPTLNSSRKQPVIIELILDSIGTGAMKQTLYCLQMKTPLASNKKFNELKRRFYESEAIQSLYKPGIKLCLDASNSSGNWGIYMSVELPLFLSKLNENPLSREEIQRSFLNLVYCADQTEKELLNKDLQKEELNVSVIKATSSSQFQLREKKGSYRSEEWQQKNGFFILENKYPLITNKENEKNSFIYNHENLFVKSFIGNGYFHHQVSHLTDDAQKIELQVLEKHWEVFLRSI